MSSEAEFFTPSIPNPYPDRPAEIWDFEYRSHLVLARLPVSVRLPDREASYIVAEPYEVAFTHGDERRGIVVPQGMLTDLVSVPRLARAIIGRVGAYLEAAIVHDFLYLAWQLLGLGPREADWRFANALMFAAMNETLNGEPVVPFRQRALIRAALQPPGLPRNLTPSWHVYRENDLKKAEAARREGRRAGLFVRLDGTHATRLAGLEPETGFTSGFGASALA